MTSLKESYSVNIIMSQVVSGVTSQLIIQL